MSTSVSFCLGTMRLERLQTFVNEYWRVTIAVLGFSTIVLVNVPTNVTSQHSPVCLLDFLGALGTSILSSPVQSLALVALGVCLLPATACMLNPAQSFGRVGELSVSSPSSCSARSGLVSVPIICKLGSHDIHVEADCSSPMSCAGVRLRGVISRHQIEANCTFHQSGAVNVQHQQHSSRTGLVSSPLITQMAVIEKGPTASSDGKLVPSPPVHMNPWLSHTSSTAMHGSAIRRAHLIPDANDDCDTRSLDGFSMASDPISDQQQYVRGRRSGTSLDESNGLGSGALQWRPKMQRIVSGQDLLALDGGQASETNCAPVSTAAEAKQSVVPGTAATCSDSSTHLPTATAPLMPAGYLHSVPDPCSAGDDAQASAQHAVRTADPVRGVEAVVSEAHLLQLGAMLGEEQSLAAVEAGQVPPPVGAEGAEKYLLGAADSKYLQEGWEQISDNELPGRVRHLGWRRLLRGGLYLYRSHTVYEGVTPAQLRAFQHDDEQRAEWDDGTLDCRRLGPSAAEAGSSPPETSPPSESAFLYCRTRFPKPLSSREYVYARRVWSRPSDGGCYSISRACAHAGAPSVSGRAVRVTDFVSAYIIRAAAAQQPGQQAAEMVTLYFEDSHVRPGIINMAVKKGMWDVVKRSATMLQQHVLLSAAEARLSPEQRASNVRTFPLTLGLGDGDDLPCLPATSSCPAGWLRLSSSMPDLDRLPRLSSFPLTLRDSSDAEAPCPLLPSASAPPSVPRQLRSHALLLSSHALVLRRQAVRLRDIGHHMAEHMAVQGAGAVWHAREVMRAARSHGSIMRRRRRAGRVQWVQRALKAVKVVAGLKLVHKVMAAQGVPRLDAEVLLG